MSSVRAEFGVDADPESNIVVTRRRGKGFRGARHYRAGSWFSQVGEDMFGARKKTDVKGNSPPGNDERKEEYPN